MKSTRNRQLRCGYTLIEVLGVIALLSIVMGAVGVLLNGAWRIERAMSRERVVLDSIGQLAEQFRNDVHRADGATVASAASGQWLALTLPEEIRIQYQASDESLERLVLPSGQTQQRESYAIPFGAKITYATDESLGRKQVSLVLSCPLEASSPEFSDRRETRVDAMVGVTPDEYRLSRAVP